MQSKSKGYFIETYGCQMNVHESETIAGQLETMGYVAVDELKQADVIVYNTCCVREHAESRVHGNIGALKSLKESKPDLKIVICGCMMQQEGVAKNMLQRFPHVDVILGTNSLHMLPRLLEKSYEGEKGIFLSEEDSAIVEGLPSKRGQGLSTSITITYGCNNYCSYCIVPYVRGRERSRKAEDIIKEAREMARLGYREIMLLGQNVNSYGLDLADGMSFAQLLREIDGIEGIERIRFMTSHPKDLSDELIDAMASCKHVSKQLHLPVQSGSNRILEAMNRKYTREHYLDLIRRLRERMPDIGLSTDVIVGFPGETEEDFQETMSLFREVRYQAAYTFKYSRRRGTVAADMTDQVPTEVKNDRLARLIELQKEIVKEHNQGFIGRKVTVLPETVSQKNEKMLMGRTDEGKNVHFIGDKSLIGVLTDVVITSKRTNVLIGELAKD